VFLRIENCFGGKIVNGVRVKYRDGWWRVGEKCFPEYKEMLDYVSKEYPLETPEAYKHLPVPKPDSEWVGMRELIRDYHTLTVYGRRLLRSRYELLYPDEMEVRQSETIFKRDNVYKVIDWIQNKKMAKCKN